MIRNHKKLLKGITASFLTIIALVFAVVVTAKEVGASELQSVITAVKLLNGNDTALTVDANNVYQLRTGQTYRLRFEFDLSDYDGKLQNGDTFSFEVAAPLDVSDETLPLYDRNTGVVVGDALIASKGAGQGATVTVTMKNLDTYLATSGATTVTDVVGDFAINFKIDQDITNYAVNFDSAAMKAIVSHIYTTTTYTPSASEGYENFAQNGGQAQYGSWFSQSLKNSNLPSAGFFYSQWRVRVNTGAQDLGANVVVHDEVSAGNIHYIPESFEIYSTAMLTARTSGVGTLKDAVKLTEGTDYAITWNADYTAFDVTIADGTKQYWIVYKTTTPNDGSIVANSLSVTKSDGTVLTQRSNNNRTVATQESTSLYSGTMAGNATLTQVVTKVKVLNGNDTEQTVDTNGIYQLRTSHSYKLRFEFDLSHYNGKLNNGDSFTFTIPEPLDVANETIQLHDSDTDVIIGEAAIVKHGQGLGATVTVTIKNLEEYLTATGGQSVVGVSGDFAAYFKIDKDVNNQAVAFNSNVMKEPVTHHYTTTSYSGTVTGYENFAQNGGQAQKGNWTSKALGTSGKFYSGWRVRVNTGKQDFGPNFTIHDEVTKGSIQYIPETLEVYSTNMLTSRTSGIGYLKDAVRLEAGKDYTITWNSDYTAFDIVFADGQKQYWITYKTTTPNDGSLIANSLSAKKADGTVITQRSDLKRTVSTQESTSLYSGKLDGKIK